jgi:hypothetical protein
MLELPVLYRTSVYKLSQESGVFFILGSQILIHIIVKSWIRIRIKVKIQEFQRLEMRMLTTEAGLLKKFFKIITILILVGYLQHASNHVRPGWYSSQKR